ncbi:MAG: hypothetical protein IIB81_04940 [Nanoarchaeota archaeon]|nr:hypothetical protein [Nanoarchaeota archaeon]
MKITERWLRDQDACEGAIIWFCNQKITDSNKLILLAIEENEEFHLKWVNWLITRTFSNEKKKIQYAVFAAELVLNIFEEKYLKDDRPRKAIEATKKYIKNPIIKNMRAAERAAENAWKAAESAAESIAKSVERNAAESAAWCAWSMGDIRSIGSIGNAMRAAKSAARSAGYNKTLIKILKHGLKL